MKFNIHDDLKDKHAFLGASKYHWLNYTDEHLKETYINQLRIQEGTETHAFASLCINRKQKLPKSNKTLNLFVNDAIGFKMESEQVLYYSENCFGTADAISYRDKFLRIHDLKTGVSPASFLQLEIYAALFCLEYKIDPYDIAIELRIYQLNEIQAMIPDAEEIESIMNKIITSDAIISKLKNGDDK